MTLPRLYKKQFLSKAIRTVAVACVASLPLLAQGQTFHVLHSFSGGSGGAIPYAGVTIDRAGNLYGTTYDGGDSGCSDCGTVYKLTRSGSNWTLAPIFAFARGQGGIEPQAGVVFGPDGALYGTTHEGGSQSLGAVFRLTPPQQPCRNINCKWNETVLHTFEGPDGAHPGVGDLVFDSAGNLYGTTEAGGNDLGVCNQSGCGTVYELSPAGDGWNERVVYGFTGSPDYGPYAGVILDNAGNLCGTTRYQSGAVYQLSLGSGEWTANTLHDFTNQPQSRPIGGLIFDSAGNLYGSTSAGGGAGSGTVFELVRSANGWSFTVLYNFTNGIYTSAPFASLTMDAAGNIYGTTCSDGASHCGTVFKLSPSNGSWSYTSLHDFTCGIDGAYPISNVSFDSAGNLYGTTTIGGTANQGTVWEITP